MIPKIKTGAGFSGALKYALEKEGAEFISTNLVSTHENISDMALEMRSVALQRDGVTKCVHHVSLSAAPGERLSDEQWQSVADDYMQSMGFNDNQFVLARHTDTDIDHVHLIINRIKFAQEIKLDRKGDPIKDPSGNEVFQGIAVSNSNEYRRANKTCEQIEIKHNLEQTNHSKKATPHNHAKISKTDIEMGFAETKTTLINRLDLTISTMLKSNTEFTAKSFAQACKTHGVDVHYNKQGDSIRGCSYSLSGDGNRKFSGTKLRRDLTFGNIRKTFNPVSIKSHFTPKFTDTQKSDFISSINAIGITGTAEKYGAKFNIGNWTAVAFDNGNAVTIKGFPDAAMTAKLTLEAAKAKGWSAINIENASPAVEAILRKQAEESDIEIVEHDDLDRFLTEIETMESNHESIPTPPEKISIGDVLRGKYSADDLAQQQEQDPTINTSKSTEKSGGRA